MGYMAILLFNGQLYLLQQTKENEVYAEKMKKEKLQSQYQALKNQIDPHFFFNSLSVLTSLVYKDPDLSADYITQLSKMYHYVLDKNKDKLVLLKEELSFLESYIFLIKIRHEENVKFLIDIPAHLFENTLIPPNSLQMLAENAVKHNRFTEDKPLIVKFNIEKGYIVISNNKNKRQLVRGSSRIGLNNIDKRFELIYGERIIVEDRDDKFIVKLPLLNKFHYESADL